MGCILCLMRWPVVLVVLSCPLALVLAGMPVGQKTSTDPDPRPLFKAKCVSCHGGAFPAGGIDLSDSADLTKLKAVVRGRPHDSSLFKAVDSGGMPKGGDNPPAEIAVIRDWIVSLRPDPRPLFQAKCVSCHGATNPAAGLSLSGSLEDLAKLKQASTDGKTPVETTLYRRIADGSMPRGGTKLSEGEMTLVRDWIGGLQPDLKPLMQAKCVRCHTGSSGAGGLDLTVSLESLAGSREVVKGNPAASNLYKRVADGTMPRGGPKLSDSEIGLFWDFVAKQKASETAAALR